MLVHCRVERATARVKCLAQKHTKQSLLWPWLEPELLDMELSALTVRPLPVLPTTSTAMKKYVRKKLEYSPLMNCERVASHQMVNWIESKVVAPAAVAVVVVVVVHSVL